MIYDVTKPETFLNLEKFYFGEAQRYRKNENAKILILGNKLDKGCQVNNEEVKNFVEEKELLHFQVSAKDGTNLEEAFTQIVSQILNDDNSHLVVTIPNNNNSNNKSQSGKKKCIIC